MWWQRSHCIVSTTVACLMVSTYSKPSRHQEILTCLPIRVKRKKKIFPCMRELIALQRGMDQPPEEVDLSLQI